MTNAMTDTDFLRHLTHFSTDRFALAQLSADDHASFYHRLISAFGHTVSAWYLISTDGCHLCEQAQDVLRIACPDTPITMLELIDAPDDVIGALGHHLPVLLTPRAIMAYPFGIMDVLALT